MAASFVHLSVHSEYSLTDSIVRIKPLMHATAAANMPAIALTDRMNLFAAVKFFRAALAAGIKPIFGADVLLREADQRATTYTATFLCQTQRGYQNLIELLSEAWRRGQVLGVPLIDLSTLTPAHCEGLIALSGGVNGHLGQALLAADPALIQQRAEYWMSRFPGRFYVELQRLQNPQETAHEAAALALASELTLPLVATNPVRFLQPDDHYAHEARVCINQGRVLDDPRRVPASSPQQYLRTPEDMVALFHDLPSAIDNTVEIAKRCSVFLTLGQSYLPDFPIPEGLALETYFRQQAEQGLEKRLRQLFPEPGTLSHEKRQAYESRLHIELDVINDMGFPGYFLIVADFIHWAKHHGVPVGPGRGSGAGSLVAYALAITDIDPLQYELLFERFLNPERVSMPDFDIDFCMEGRDRVIEYVSQKYGRDCVSQIITFGTMAAKAVVRDVGRVLGHPYGFVDKIAKLIPFEIGMTLEKALQQEEALLKQYQEDGEVQDLINLAKSLEGITRNVGKHAGGVVIAPGKLTDFTPLYCEDNDAALVSQFDKDDVEAVGLVKFDFLGLRNLTIIDSAVKNINQTHGANAHLDITQIPMDDAKAFELLKACQTTAVFQLESRGMKDLIKRLQPDCFEDIIALVALFRPGPLQSGMVDDFIDRKHGRAAVAYPHPALESILKPTYGVILYQEQVMQIAQVLANYSLGSADLLRRAMGKKKPEEMERQRAIFLKGATERGVESAVATHIFDLMEKFAGYGFNKSHSAAYALVSYQTAYLKAHYPAEFMAAVLSSDMDNTDKVVMLLEDCHQLGLSYLPPDINQSQIRFSVNAQGQLLYGLGAIKGVGENALEQVIAERDDGGVYRDLFEFCNRIELKKINRRTLEALIKAGAMDCFHQNRATLFASMDIAVQSAEQQRRDLHSGQADLFSLNATDTTPDAVPWRYRDEWPEAKRLQGEKETLGLFLTGHPINQFESVLPSLVSSRIAEVNLRDGARLTLAGYVTAIRIMQTKRGDRIAFLTLDDRTGRMEIGVFAEAFQAHRELLQKDALLVIDAEVSQDRFSGILRLSAERVQLLESIATQQIQDLCLWIEEAEWRKSSLLQLKQVLQNHQPGACPVILEYQSPMAIGQIECSTRWQVKPMDSLMATLQKIPGVGKAQFRYRSKH